MTTSERTVAYTDGACLGNPGPGGWAWAVPGGRWRSGANSHTTNQRMEIAAALDAVRTLDGPLEVVSDSTYVVNCFRQQWWKKWVTNGWVSTSRQPVANRDLWEPLVELYRAAPGRVEFRWVKGHATDPFNDLVDRLAVAAATSQRGGEGDQPPGAGSLGPADAPASGRPPSAAPSRAGRPPAAPPTRAGRTAASSAATGASPQSPPPAMSPRPILTLPGMGPGLGAIVRLATAADAAATIELWRTAGARPSRTDDVASVRGLLARDPEALIVAEAPEGLVGSVIAGFDGWRANLYRLAVHPDWRRQGLARALVAEAERQLVARGAQRASAIVVEEDDDAVAFWAAVGYRGEAHQARYVKNLFVTP